MKRELGIARCGLACCLCLENEHCGGCDAGDCPMAIRCENRSCSRERGIMHCFECEEICRKGILMKIKPFGFSEFARRYGVEMLLDRLATNEQAGIVYHRHGIMGDYDAFEDVEALISFIQVGDKQK